MLNEKTPDQPGDEDSPAGGESDLAGTAPYRNSALDRARNVLDEIPSQIGPFRVLERIGQGGMGDVLRAEQREPIRREVALKLVKLGMDTKLVLARFEAERQALAMMNHPHIAKVFEASADENGRPYFVMEYVRGKPITEYADLNHLSIPERLELFCQVCQAIQHAHHKGIIHRDVKPSNVLVSTQDGKPFAKVIDFGIAKATATQLTERTLYTLHDQFIGTPQYMSPEQAEGSADIDTRTDVYSLGVLLYELLTGSTPFGGAELRDAALDQVKRIIRESEPPKPSTRLSQSGATLPALAAARRTEPNKLGTIVRGELDWIVMSALDKDRRRRYDTPNSFADDVQRYLKGEPVEAAPPSRAYQFSKFARRYRWPLAVAGSALVLLAGFSAVVAGLAVKLKQTATVAQQKQAEAEAERKAAEEARLESEAQRDKAETQAYVNTLAAAQSAMAANNWPDARRRLDSAPEKFRGWEWEFLRCKATAPLIGLTQAADAVKMTENASHAILVNDDVVSLVNLGSQSVVANYNGRKTESRYGWYWGLVTALSQTGELAAVEFESDALVYRDSTQVCKVDTKVLGEYVIRDLEFDQSGKQLLVKMGPDNGRNNEGDIGVFDVATGSLVGKHAWSGGNIDRLTNAIDRGTLVLPAGLGKLRVAALSGATIREVALAEEQAFTSEYALSGEHNICAIATSYRNSWAIEVRAIEGGDLLASFAFDGDAPIASLAISPDGRTVAAEARDSTIRVWDLDTKILVAETRRETAKLRFASDGERLIGFTDGSFWSWRQGDIPAAWRDPAGDANVVAFSADGSRALSLDGGRVRLWDTSLRSMQPSVMTITRSEDDDRYQDLEIGPVTCPMSNWGDALAQAALVVAESGEGLAFNSTTARSADGAWRVERATNGRLEVVNSEGKKLLRLPGAPRAVLATLDGRRLIVAGQDGAVRYFDTASWTEVGVVQLDAPVTGMSLSADGTRMVLFTADNGLHVWDTRPSTEREAADARYAAAFEAAQEYPRAEAKSLDNLGGLLSDHSLQPYERVAALAAIRRQLDNDVTVTRAIFSRLQRELVFKDSVVEKVATMDLTPNQRRLIDEDLAKWEQTDEDRHNELFGVAENPDSSEELIRAALKIAEANLAIAPGRISNRTRVASLLYRMNDFARARDLFLEGTDWFKNEDRVWLWNAHYPNQCYVAMAEHKLGRRSEAIEYLRGALRYWNGNYDSSAPFSSLQEEAATMIYPKALTPAQWPKSEAFLGVDAIDASEAEELLAFVGEDVTVKGRIVRVSPTRDGSNANLVFDPPGKGLLGFIALENQSGLSWSSVRAFEGKEVKLTGQLKTAPDAQTIAVWARNRPQIILDSLDQIEVIGDGNDEVAWWNVALREIEAEEKQAANKAPKVEGDSAEGAAP